MVHTVSFLGDDRVEPAGHAQGPSACAENCGDAKQQGDAETKRFFFMGLTPCCEAWALLA